MQAQIEKIQSTGLGLGGFIAETCPSVVKIRPPMPFDMGNADLLLETMEKVLRENF